MHLTAFGICVLKYRGLITSLSAQGFARQAALKKTKVKLDLLTNYDMLLLVEKVGGGICHVID